MKFPRSSVRKKIERLIKDVPILRVGFMAEALTEPFGRIELVSCTKYQYGVVCKQAFRPKIKLIEGLENWEPSGFKEENLAEFEGFRESIEKRGEIYLVNDSEYGRLSRFFSQEGINCSILTQKSVFGTNNKGGMVPNTIKEFASFRKLNERRRRMMRLRRFYEAEEFLEVKMAFHFAHSEECSEELNHVRGEINNVLSKIARSGRHN